MSEIKVELKKKRVKGKIVYVILISSILFFAFMAIKHTDFQQLAQSLLE